VATVDNLEDIQEITLPFGIFTTRRAREPTVPL
jgi:hypothetical protein